MTTVFNDLDWMENMQEHIARKPYKNKSSFWLAAKMRYIFHITGPICHEEVRAAPSQSRTYAETESP